MKKNHPDNWLGKSNGISQLAPLSDAITNFKLNRRKKELEFLIIFYTKLVFKFQQLQNIHLAKACNYFKHAFQDELDNNVRRFCDSDHATNGYKEILLFENESNSKFNLPKELKKCRSKHPIIHR